MNIHQFLLAVRGRLWVFLSLLVATVLAAVFVTLAMPKTYEATASILVDTGATTLDQVQVTGIRGSLRHRNCRAIGQDAHAGGAPRRNRRDGRGDDRHERRVDARRAGETRAVACRHGSGSRASRETPRCADARR